LPGFRKGKTPATIISALRWRSEERSIGIAVPRYLREAITKKTRAYLAAAITDLKMEEGKSLYSSRQRSSDA